MDVGYVESFGAAVPSAAAPELESEPQDVQTARARASAGIRAAMFTNRGLILMLRSLRAHGRATRGVRRKTPGARTICRREAACHQPQGAPGNARTWLPSVSRHLREGGFRLSR